MRQATTRAPSNGRAAPPPFQGVAGVETERPRRLSPPTFDNRLAAWFWLAVDNTRRGWCKGAQISLARKITTRAFI